MVDIDTRHCQFCDVILPPTKYPRHLRDQHRMTCVRPDTAPGDTLRCMFCLETVLEVEYPAHVFHHHKISGLYLEAEDRGPGGCRESKFAQTGGDEDIWIDLDDERVEEREQLKLTLDNRSTNDQSQIINSEDVSAEPEVREMDPLDVDSDESDFELDCQCSFCLHADMEQDNECPDISLTDRYSPALQEAATTSQTQSEESFKSQPESPKKVTFADITNYYPMKKLGWLEKLKIREGKSVKRQILGPDTTLKYLKYWGTTTKPQANSSDVREKATRKKSLKNRDSDAKSMASLRSLGVGVVWRCPKGGCNFSGKNIISVRKHFYSHFPSN